MQVGIVGTGWGRTHVGTIRACGHEVAVIVGRDSDRTRQIAADEGIPVGTNDPCALEDVDVVVIASPTPSHARLIEQFIHEPVLCEKPLVGIRASEAFARRIAKSEVRLFVNYAFSFLRSAEQLTACASSGDP